MWFGWKAIGLGGLGGAAVAAVLFAALAPGSTPPIASVPVLDVVPTVTYADCVPPAQLEGAECVTHLTVTRTVPPGSGAAAVPTLPAAPSSAGGSPTPDGAQLVTPPGAGRTDADEDDTHEEQDGHDDESNKDD